MLFKKRTYISYNASLANGNQINLQTAYNAGKSGDEKLSDDTVSGLATFGEIIFHHDKQINVILDTGDAQDEIIFPIHATGETAEHKVPGGKNVIFKNDSGSSVALKIFASVLSQPNVAPSAAPYPYAQ